MQNLDLSFAQDPNTLALGLVAGLIPALLWLFFWTRENSEFPKQSGILFKAFLCGAIAVMAVLPVQEYIATLSNNMSVLNVLWAASEEVLKYLAFAVAILSARTVNRPVDYAVYIMVCALGFAGLENALYFLGALQSGDTAVFVLSETQRFVGTTLLHALTSSCVGMGIGFAFFGSKTRKVLYGLIGLCVGIFIHSAFNAYATAADTNFTIQICVLWAVAIVALVVFERLRTMGGIEYMRARNDAGIDQSEKIFQSLLGKAALLPSDDRSIRDALVSKNVSTNDLDAMILSLRTDYALHLENRGATPEGAQAAASALISDAVSPKTVTMAIATIRDHEIPTVLASKLA